MPVRFLLMIRRLNFLSYILHEEETSLIYNILQDQIKKTLKFDWINLIKQDLVDLEIGLSYCEISQMNQQEFKKRVQEQTEKAAFKYLMTEKQNLSKLKNINYKKFELAKHLKADMILTRSEVNSMMNFRSRMTNLKGNYKSSYK